MTRVQPGPGAPGWALALCEAINRALGELAWPRVRSVTNATSAPPAAGAEGRMIWVRDIRRIAVSDGVSWIRQDTGAPI